MRMSLRRTLMLAGGTLAVAGLMAAYSYSTATVNNPVASMTVTNTQTSLLALHAVASPANDGGFNAIVTRSDSLPGSAGELIFNLDNCLSNHNGPGTGSQCGIQPNSTYTWDDLFTVTNNSNANVNVTISATNNTAQNTVEFNEYNAPTDFATNYTFALAAGATAGVDVQASGIALERFGHFAVVVTAVQ